MSPTEQAADRVKALADRLRGDGSSWAQPLFNEAADALTALQARAEDAERRVEEMEQADSRWVIRFSEVREASGIGYAPMLSEVPAAIRAKLGGYEFVCALDAARSEAQPSGYDGGKSLGERPIRPDLAIGAITVAMKTTTDGEVGPWLQTALDFLTGEYEPLDDAALTFTASLSDASPKPSSDEQET